VGFDCGCRLGRIPVGGMQNRHHAVGSNLDDAGVDCVVLSVGKIDIETGWFVRIGAEFVGLWAG